MTGKKFQIPTPIKILLAVCGLAGLGLLLYQIPAVNNRLSWRLDFASAYVRGVIDPVKQLPTPVMVVQAAVLPSETPMPSPTPAAKAPIGPTATHSATPLPSPTATPIPANALIPAPRYEKQDINNCGPATLSMALNFFGWKGDQKTISDEIKPLREDRNVNVEELVQYARNKAGWLQTEYRVGGNLQTIKQLVAAGIPVMIEEAFIMNESYWPNDDRWAGHYLYINGYDDGAATFMTQDVFISADHPVSYSELDKNWQTFNRVYILLFRPDQANAVKSILADDWPADNNRARALETARKETTANPKNAFAWFNLGSNLVYFERYDEAVRAYDQARTLGLPQRMLRYQFGPFISYFQSLRTDDLMTLTEYALKITPNSEETMLWRGWGLYRQGHKADAIDLFKKALEAQPGYPDAAYALSFVQKN
jgi:tetratricopeptide (TPR) repeat protein